MKAKKILVIRFSSIGDIVLTTPVIRCLKLQLNAEVHFLTKKQFAPILAPNPHLSKILYYDGDIKQLRREIKAERYDFIVDLHNNLRSRLAAVGRFIPVRRYEKLNWQKWLLVRFKQNKMPDLHIVDRYLATAVDLGVINDGRGLDYFLLEQDQHIDGLPTEDFLALVVGAAHATKRMPSDMLKEIVSMSRMPVVILGGRQDVNTGKELEDYMPNRVVNRCGKLTLGQSAYVIKLAKKVVTPDTGLMHIAAAFNKEIISVWGSTVPEFGMTPYRISNSFPFEVKDLSCRPCSKIGYSKCPQGHFNCMKLIDLERMGQCINQS